MGFKQGNPKSTLTIHWKDWCWSWSSNTLATWCEEVTHWIKPGKDRRQEEKRMTGNEMVGWYHWLNGHECEQAPGEGEGQGSLVCYSLWVTKSQTWLSDWTELLPTCPYIFLLLFIFKHISLMLFSTLNYILPSECPCSCILSLLGNILSFLPFN